MSRRIIIPSPLVFARHELLRFEQEILDNKHATEHQASKFLARHPKFLAVGGYGELAREVCLCRGGKHVFRVDFCRRKYGEEFWDFVELKSPANPLFVRRGRHWKLSSQAEAGLHQAQDYRDWVENEPERLELATRTGIAAYRPKLLIVAGRSKADVDALEVRRLLSSGV